MIIIKLPVLELNHVRDCVISSLSKCFFISADRFIGLLSVVDDLSLVNIDSNDENLVHGINILRFGLLQMLCLENLYIEEADKEEKCLYDYKWKKVIRQVRMEAFQYKKSF